MVVYVEYVAVNNFCIDYLLLLLTKTTLKRSDKGCRQVLASLFGSAVALTYPLLENVKILLTVYKLVSGAIIILIAFNVKSLKEFTISFCLFVILTFFSGGIIYALYLFLGIDYSTELPVALILLPFYIVYKAIRKIINYIKKGRDVLSCVVKANVVLGGVKTELNGLIDTGNNLYYKSSPVVFCGKNTLKKLIKSDGVNLLDIKRVNVQVGTVNGSETYSGIVLDKVIIIDNGEYTYDNVILCVSKTWTSAYYDVILHSAFIRRENASGNFAKTQKVS